MREKDLGELTTAYALEIVRTGCDATNYKILGMLPVTTTELGKKLGLSKMPVCVRVRALETVGLVNYIKPKELRKTELTDMFFSLVDGIKDVVAKDLLRYMRMKIR